MKDSGWGVATSSPTPIKPTSTTTFRAVTTTCNRLPARRLMPCTSVSSSTTLTASSLGGNPGHTLPAYCSRASAAAAVGAANPTVADTQPDRKPSAGW